jgi:hypothetical protein
MKDAILVTLAHSEKPITSLKECTRVTPKETALHEREPLELKYSKF